MAKKKQNKSGIFKIALFFSLLIFIIVASIFILNPKLKQLTLPIIPAVTINLTETPTPTQTLPSNCSNYTDPNIKYSFKCPLGWQANLHNPEKFLQLGKLVDSNLSRQTFKKGGYEMSFEEGQGGGATYRIIAKSEPVQLYGLSLIKVYLNDSESCQFYPEPTGVPTADCTNNFNTILLLSPNNLVHTNVDGVDVPFVTYEVPYFRYNHYMIYNGSAVAPYNNNGFNIQLVTPSLINISDINSNPYISDYNKFISSVNITKVFKSN